MSGVSLPVSRPTGRALIVGQPDCRIAPMAALMRLGFVCTEIDDPYDGMLQLCRRPLFYTSMVLSLNSLYREELQVIASIKRRFAHVEIWLVDTDGRQAALAEAMRLGADGLVAPDGLHRIATPLPANPPTMPAAMPPKEPLDDLPEPTKPKLPIAPAPATASVDPLLTAEELRALLQESHVPRGN